MIRYSCDRCGDPCESADGYDWNPNPPAATVVVSRDGRRRRPLHFCQGCARGFDDWLLGRLCLPVPARPADPGPLGPRLRAAVPKN